MKTTKLYLAKLKSYFIDRMVLGAAGYIGQRKYFQEMLSERPFMIHINNTNICNSSCSFCAYKYQSVPPTTMNLQLFKRLVDEYENMGGGHLSLTPIVGEPLVSKDMLACLEYLSSKPSIRVLMVTNGILIDKYGADVLLDYIHSWTISMSGFDESMYLRMFRTKEYHRVKKNILDLLKANSRRSEPRGIQISMRSDKPIKELMSYPDFQEVLEYKPAVQFTHKYSDFGGLISNKDFESPVNFYKKRHKLGFKCFVATRGLTVCPDGTVLACGCFEAINYPQDLRVGNVNEQSLLDIWKGEERREFLESFGPFKARRSVCQNCKTYRPEYFLYTKIHVSEMERNMKRWKQYQK
ncbi:MAG: radical SAM protein [Phycisphaerae bacterium]|nr:radical SAM protein [Phycisphaerae bacterium]